MSVDPVEPLRRKFDEMYGDEGVELPAELEPPGSFSHGRWHVRYAVNACGDGTCLDLIVETPNIEQLIRILPDGELEVDSLFSASVYFDPDIDADEDAARERHDREQGKLGDLLRERRLL